jgi:hypothetical protein
MDMRAQASMEYLLISVVSLSLISISALSLLAIKETSSQGRETLVFRNSADSLSIAASELCALGSGNGREVLLQAEIAVESENTEEGWLSRFSDGNRSLVRKTYCEIESGRWAGLVYAENEDGKIRLTER